MCLGNFFSLLDPCENFRCKRGKTCKLNEEKKPMCVCREPSACPQSVTDYDHVSRNSGHWGGLGEVQSFKSLPLDAASMG